jgi:predicted glycoside hydrolase/deacetylase ChbG (UPF0249 family)
VKNPKSTSNPPPSFPRSFQELIQKFTIGTSFLLALITLPLYAFKVSEKTDYTDFSVYYRAALRMKLGDFSQIYSLRDGASPFRYSPLFLPFFRPFAELGLPAAQMVWYFFQFACFGLGFYLIYRTLQAFKATHPLCISCFSFLFILRFCLDTFTIGQVSSLMFLGFTLAFYAWVVRKPVLFSLGLLIPTLFKIGPGFLFGVFASSRFKEKRKGILTTLAVIGTWGVTSSLALGSWSVTRNLWLSWTEIVAKDSQYYDASHYGSQSLKSFLLRSMNSGWITSETVQIIYISVAILLCGGAALFWLTRRPRSYYGRGLFYSLGIFIYLWLMPETFKYSLTPLAIPVALILTRFGRKPHPSSIFRIFALGFGMIVLSLAGKDIVGDTLFFGFQVHSMPLLATVFLAIEISRLAWRESVPATGLAAFIRLALGAISLKRKQLGPWTHLPLPLIQRKLEASLLIPVPFHSSLPLNRALTRKVITEAYDSLKSESTLSGFEMLIIIYGDRISALNPIYQTILSTVQDKKEIRILEHKDNNGRASALRAGFLASSGKKILIGQIEQPSYPQFFTQALKLLDSGIDLVRANRRLPETRFLIPVQLLPLVYRRHRLGLLFNRLVRTFLPIHTTDTHSGTLGMSWRLALNSFALQTSPDFLFDLEISLTALGHGFQEKDLPVSFELGHEKSVGRMTLETLNILRGLPSLAARFKKGFYQPLSQSIGITADDWGLSPAINRGILQLVQAGVIRRVSMMANTAYLEEGLEDLKKFPVELGLHFNLTYGRPLKGGMNLASSPGKLLLLWFKPFQDRKALHARVRLELTDQLSKLEAVGVKASYLDGHHHIQLIPGLVHQLADIIQKHGIRQIRLPYDKALLKSFKAPLVLFSLLNRPGLKRWGFESMTCFYPQTNHFLDHGLFRARLSRTPEAEVIVHPADLNDLAELEFPDSYTEGRVLEYRALRMLELQP